MAKIILLWIVLPLFLMGEAVSYGFAVWKFLSKKRRQYGSNISHRLNPAGVQYIPNLKSCILVGEFPGILGVFVCMVAMSAISPG